MTTTLALLGSSIARVEAGNSEWATAGKVLTGVGAGLLLAKALEPRAVVYDATPVYTASAPVVVYQPAPVAVQQPVQVVVQQPAPVVVEQPAQVVQQVVAQPALVVAQPAQVVAQPTVVYTQPVVVQQRAVVYQTTPVVVRAPVVYAPPVRRVYVAPRPVIGFHFSIGHHHHGRAHW